MKPLRPVKPRIPAEIPAMDANDVRLKKSFKLFVIIDWEQMKTALINIHMKHKRKVKYQESLPKPTARDIAIALGA